MLTRESVRPAEWGAGEAERPEDADARAVRELLELPDRPTAVLCFSDVMAYRVVRTAEELGLRVPEDLSVVGFDDSPLARRMRPALTTVRQDVSGKGRAATAAPDGGDRGGQDGTDSRAARSGSCCPPSSWSGTAPHRRPAERGCAPGVPARAC